MNTEPGVAPERDRQLDVHVAVVVELHLIAVAFRFDVLEDPWRWAHQHETEIDLLSRWHFERHEDHQVDVHVSDVEELFNNPTLESAVDTSRAEESCVHWALAQGVARNHCDPVA